MKEENKMKKALLVLVAMVSLLGCHTPITNISEVQNKFQNWDVHIISDSIQKGDSTIYYFYGYYGESHRQAGWYCWEYTCDKTGLILKKKEYWIGSDLALKEFRESLKQGIFSQ